MFLLLFAAAGVFGAPGKGKYTEPEALAKLLAEKTEPFMLVDVRTPEEFAAGRIPGAVNIPVDVIEKNPPTRDKNALVILYCRSGNRSSYAKRLLEALGYTRIEDFGGIGRWKGSLEKGS